MTDDIAILRAEVGRHHGRARTGPLLRLGQALADRYWRAGPGQPAARSSLDENITVLAEAYGHFDPADAWRGQVAALLGQQYAIRRLAHFGAEDDRVKGMALLGEALAFARLPAALRLPSLMMLGQLHLAGVLAGPTAGASADVDRAEECFRQAMAAPQLGAEVADGIRSMLEITALLRETRPAGVAQSFRRLRDIQASMKPVIVMPWPADRPVAVVDVPAPERPARRPAPRPATAARRDAGTYRSALHTLLPAAGDAIAAARALLHENPSRARTDELVALTVGLAAADPGDGTNHLLLAVALRHRARAEPADIAPAVAALRTATRLLQPLDPPTRAVTEELGECLGFRHT